MPRPFDRIFKVGDAMNKTQGLRLIGFRKSIPRTLFLAIAVASICTLTATWWLVSTLGFFPAVFFPSPQRVFYAAVRMFASEGFAWDVFMSVLRVLTAFAVAALVAIPLALVMSSFKPFEAFVEPIIDFVRYVPVPSLLPLIVLWSGIGETSKFIVLFVGTFFQLVLLVKDDADNVPPILFDLARTMGASSRHLIRDVLVPYLLPQIYDRLRVTLGWCWTYLVIAELIAVQRGVGHAIKEAQRFNASDQLFVCFIVLGVIGLATDFIAKFFYHVLFPYAKKTRV